MRPQNLDQFAFLKLKPAEPASRGQNAVERSPGLRRREGPEPSEFRASIAQGVNTFLALIYAMLLLAVIIALMGIANTLSLSVYERTSRDRPAPGRRRRAAQIRSMVRWESVLDIAVRDLRRMAIGVFLGWALVKAGSDKGLATFDPGILQLVIVVIVGAVVGMLAAIRPARRAAKLDVLLAISA